MPPLAMAGVPVLFAARRPSGGRQQGAMPLQDHDRVVSTAEFRGHIQPLVLDLGDRKAGQSCHLAGMGR